MITLGIDPGTTRIGYGVVQQDPVGPRQSGAYGAGKNRLVCVEYGILKNSGDKIAGFKKAAQELDKLIKKFRPDRVGVEKLFFFKNQKTVMAVSEMRGALLLTLSRHGIPIREFTPLQVKQSISGYGRADKAQVQRMVRLILDIKTEIKPDDAADALAIAICCANTNMWSDN